MRDPHPLTPYPPLWINACLTGMVPDKTGFPHVPISPEEIIQDALEVASLGVQILHIHARGEDGLPTWKADVYAKILPAIRRVHPDVILCVTTSGRVWTDFERRVEVLDLTGAAKPDMASLTLGSLNFPTGAHLNSPDMIERMAQRMLDRKIKPELEIFELGMLDYARYLHKHNLLRPPFYFNFLLGNRGTAPATLGQLDALINALPNQAWWAVGGIGCFQLPMVTAGLIAGGGVRVGLEDNLYYDRDKKIPARNVDLVKRIIRLANECGRSLASAKDIRTLLGL